MVKKLLNKKKKRWITFKNLYLSREEVINYFRDYVEMLSDAKYDSKHSETERKELKILTPKQMLQRLPIALAQVQYWNALQSKKRSY